MKKDLIERFSSSSFLMKYHLVMGGLIMFSLIIGLPVFLMKIMLIVLFLDNLGLFVIHKLKEGQSALDVVEDLIKGENDGDNK